MKLRLLKLIMMKIRGWVLYFSLFFRTNVSRSIRVSDYYLVCIQSHFSHTKLLSGGIQGWGKTSIGHIFNFHLVLKDLVTLFFFFWFICWESYIQGQTQEGAQSPPTPNPNTRGGGLWKRIYSRYILSLIYIYIYTHTS